jgi:hypothetical protein
MNSDFADEVIRQNKIVEEGARKAALKAKRNYRDANRGRVEEILPQRYAKKREGKQTTFICPNCGMRKPIKWEGMIIVIYSTGKSR